MDDIGAPTPQSSSRLSESSNDSDRRHSMRRSRSTKSFKRKKSIEDLKKKKRELERSSSNVSFELSLDKQSLASIDTLFDTFDSVMTSRRASMDTSRAPSSSGKPSHEPERGVRRSTSLDFDLSLVPESKHPSRAEAPKEEQSTNKQQPLDNSDRRHSMRRSRSTKSFKRKKSIEDLKKKKRELERSSSNVSVRAMNQSFASMDTSDRFNSVMTGRSASMDTSRAPSSSGKPSHEPKRGVRRATSLDFDLSLVPESKHPSRAEAPKEEQSTNKQQPLDNSDRRLSMRRSRSTKSFKRKKSIEDLKKKKRELERSSSNVSFDRAMNQSKPSHEPKRGVRRATSLDCDLSLVPESKQPQRSMPLKRSVSLSALSAHKGESKLRKAAQMKAESKLGTITEKVEAPKEQHTTKKTKPKKVVQWSDRIRGKKAVDYSDVDPFKIWYSPQEICELREMEKNVLQGLAVGFSRACRDSALLNVEGLFTKKQQLEMSGRRASSKKAVFGFRTSRKGYVPTEGAIAEQYEEFSRPASRSAQKRAARLSSHVFGLWNAHQQDENALENEDDTPVPPPPSIYSQNCMSQRLKRQSSISNIISTSLSSLPSSSNKSLRR